MADKMAVIGAGQMGNGIAHVFAQSGFAVTMIDVSDAALARGRDTVASNLDRQIKKGSILGVPAKLRYWDLYRDKYSDLAKDAQGAFRNLFGDAFAKAYEEQLERLQGLARGREK